MNWHTLLHMRRTDAACAVTRWQYFYGWNDVMAPILKVWRHIENPTPSISLHLVYLKNIPATNFIPIWFETMSPQHEEQQQQQEEQDD